MRKFVVSLLALCSVLVMAEEGRSPWDVESKDILIYSAKVNANNVKVIRINKNPALVIRARYADVIEPRKFGTANNPTCPDEQIAVEASIARQKELLAGPNVYLTFVSRNTKKVMFTVNGEAMSDILVREGHAEVDHPSKPVNPWCMV